MDVAGCVGIVTGANVLRWISEIASYSKRRGYARTYAAILTLDLGGHCRNVRFQPVDSNDLAENEKEARKRKR